MRTWWHLQAQLDAVTLAKSSMESINRESADNHCAAFCSRPGIMAN